MSVTTAYGGYCRSLGDYSIALKHYTNLREYIYPPSKRIYSYILYSHPCQRPIDNASNLTIAPNRTTELHPHSNLRIQSRRRPRCSFQLSRDAQQRSCSMYPLDHRKQRPVDWTKISVLTMLLEALYLVQSNSASATLPACKVRKKSIGRLVCASIWHPHV